MSAAAFLAFAFGFAAAPPIACPPGTEPTGAAPPDGYEAHCAGKDAAGRSTREGPARTWYDDGAPWIEESFAAGLRDGRFVERHRNGQIAREGAYVAGRKVGTWRVYFESGVLEEESEWRDGVANGRFTAFWPGGAKRTEGRHCGGAQCGRWRTYDAAGSLLGEVEYGEQRAAP